MTRRDVAAKRFALFANRWSLMMPLLVQWHKTERARPCKAWNLCREALPVQRST